MSKENNNLKVLEELTKKLTPIDNIVKSCIFDIHLSVGSVVEVNLFRKEDNVTVSRAFMAKGSKFLKHKHELTCESFFVIEGKISFFLNDVNYILEKFDNIFVKQNEYHCGESFEDSLVVCVSAPKEKIKIKSRENL